MSAAAGGSSDDEPRASRKRDASSRDGASRAKRLRPTPSRSPSTAADDERALSGRRTRQAEAPVSLAQLQAQEREMDRLKARMVADEKEKAAALRKGERKPVPPSPSSSKRARARALRQNRRSPRSPAAADPRLAGLRTGVPMVDLDDSDLPPRSHREFASSADAVKAAVLHSTAWRNVRLETAPRNVLADAPGVALPFAAQFDNPLSDYADDPRALADKCRTALRAAVEERVHALVEEAAPLLKSAHSSRGKTILANARRQVRAYLAALPQHRAQVEETAGRSFRPLQISRLEKVATRTILKNLVDHRVTAPIQYTVGRGESAQSERPVVHTRVVTLSRVAGISRSTTCMETRGTVRVDDDPIIRFVPLFTDDNKAADARYTERFDGFGGGSQRGFLSALDDERKELLLRYVVAGCEGSPLVFSALKELGHFKQPLTDYAEIYNQSLRAKWRVAQAADVARLTSGVAPGYSDSARAAVRRLVAGYKQRALGGLLRDRLAPPPVHFALLHLRAPRDGLALAAGPRDDYEVMVARYRNFFCRRCFAYNCVNHGLNQPIPSTRVDPRYPAVRAALRLQRETEQKMEEELRRSGGEATGNSSSGGGGPGSDCKDEPTAGDADNNANVVDAATTAGERKSEDGEGGDAASLNAVTVDDGAEDDGGAIRRSARSLTAASTKASTILVSQRSKEKKKSPYARAYRGPHSDVSEYLGYDALYRSVTLERRTQLLALDAAAPCGPDCAKLSARTSDADTDVDGSEWSPAELLLLGKLATTLGPQPCAVAAVLRTRSCADVAACLRRRAAETSSDAEALISYARSSRELARPVGARGNSHEHLRRTREQRMKDRGANHEFVPCQHEGVACNSGDCSCMRRDHYCEKACGCPLDCANRFPGCKCEPGQCRSGACPCYVAGRECDPDVCFACGASELPVEAYGRAGQRKWREQTKLCGNVNLLRGRMRQVGVAPSDTHGWGAFAREPMAPGDFIYEYTGELLTQDEAERRGNIYDKSTVSFLFDLNEDAVVDATRKGNKSKFANHSSAHPKCVARILRVNGEHRIGIFANADIAADEELFFDYGYHGVVPDWTQARVASAKHTADLEVEKTDDVDGGKEPATDAVGSGQEDVDMAEVEAEEAGESETVEVQEPEQEQGKGEEEQEEAPKPEEEQA
ncbi:hypothetical protein PybrP1_012884 [[Pythium] brassicae (nom. inval.)]|nr:hypothetical protein PybrP1_012884 [[Pythium] brassicae (nom. inval.)]